MTLPYRPLRVFGSIGLGLLVISTAGAIFALNPSGAKGQRAGEPSPTGTNRSPAPLVSYGIMDVETPGVMPLYPVQAGRVIEVPVHENQSVKKGTILLRLDNRLAKDRLDQAKADLDAATADVNLARKLPEQMQAKTEQQQAAIEAVTRDLNAARLLHTRKKELLEGKQPLINAHEVAIAEEQVKKAEAGLKAEQAKLRELQTVDPKISLTKAEAQIASKKSQLDQAQLALEETEIVAPLDGEVLQLLVGPGSLQTADPRQPALFFAPNGPRVVRVEIEQEFANRMSVGLPVKVQDEYGTSPERTGKVSRMADWYSRPRTQLQDPMRMLGNDVRTLECIITLEPGPMPFRLGQRVRVTTGKLPGE